MITPGEFVATLASELALRGVPNRCAFVAVEFWYPENGIRFQLRVIYEGKGVSISNALSTEEIASMENPLREISLLVEAMRGKLQENLAPRVELVTVN